MVVGAAVEVARTVVVGATVDVAAVVVGAAVVGATVVVGPTAVVVTTEVVATGAVVPALPLHAKAASSTIKATACFLTVRVCHPSPEGGGGDIGALGVDTRRLRTNEIGTGLPKLEFSHLR